jgi:hypothetical protein
MSSSTLTEVNRARGESHKAQPLLFYAETHAGIVRLSLEGTAHHALDAAIALDAFTDLLDALDCWLGIELAWRWCPSDAPSINSCSCALAHVHADDADDAGATCRIEWPWPLLRQLVAPDESLACRLHWDAAPAMLRVAQLTLDEDERSMLEPGGALLVPQSMRDGWRGWLRAVDEPTDAGLPLPLAAPAASPNAHTSTSTDATSPVGTPGADLYELRLGLPGTLPTGVLAGWQRAPLNRLSEYEATLWRCTEGNETACKLASGILVPWGDGWAMHIQALNT